MGPWKYAGTIAITAVLLAAVGIVLFTRRRRRSIPTPTPTPLTQHPNHTHPTTTTLLSSYTVTVANTIKECEDFLQSHVPDPVRVVGLDCEWRGTSYHTNGNAENNKGEEISESESGGGGRILTGGGLQGDCPVALLQLAFTNRKVLLVRLCCMGGVGSSLRELLTDKCVLKFGVGIGNDIQRLTAAVGVVTVGCIDLQHIAVRCGIRTGTSLQGLSRQLLGIELDKSFHLQCGDWEAGQLTDEQINYAALDALVALHILQALVELKITRHDSCESVSLIDSNTHTQLPSARKIISHDQHSNSTNHSLARWLDKPAISTYFHSLCQGVIDVRFKRSSKTASSAEKGPPSLKKTSAYSVRRSHLYHNCRLLAPDGQLLSTMDRKKLEWYLERGLGTLVCKSPMTVQLNFEPSGRPGVDREYYLREKENICAVCGTDQNCVRKNIIPHEYRRHFPTLMKEHISHDVLLLCVSCHQLASQHSARLKQQIAAEHGLHDDTSSQKYKEDPKLKQIKNHARVLFKGTTGIPEERVRVLLGSVASYHGIESSELTREMIEEAAKIDPRSPNSGWVSHSEQVVSTLLAEGGEERLFQFERRWRQYFLDTMSPNFLPECWSVDHNPR